MAGYCTTELCLMKICLVTRARVGNDGLYHKLIDTTITSIKRNALRHSFLTLTSTNKARQILKLLIAHQVEALINIKSI